MTMTLRIAEFTGKSQASEAHRAVTYQRFPHYPARQTSPQPGIFLFYLWRSGCIGKCEQSGRGRAITECKSVISVPCHSFPEKLIQIYFLFQLYSQTVILNYAAYYANITHLSRKFSIEQVADIFFRKSNSSYNAIEASDTSIPVTHALAAK